MNDKDIAKILRKRNACKNIIAPDLAAIDEGKGRLVVAPGWLRGIAQGVIDAIGGHRHLRSANILISVSTKKGDLQKFEAGDRMCHGKASKASSLSKLLTAGGKGKISAVDFVVNISGDALQFYGACDKKLKMLDSPAGLRRTIALLDHELSHCGAKIIGKYIPDKEIDNFVDGLGKRHIETCREVLEGGKVVKDEIVNDKRDILVRYFAADNDSNLIFKINPHDIEEFSTVAGRHGAYNPTLSGLYDELKEYKGATLFPDVPKDSPPDDLSGEDWGDEHSGSDQIDESGEAAA